jgi:hypothetical protein
VRRQKRNCNTATSDHLYRSACSFLPMSKYQTRSSGPNMDRISMDLLTIQDLLSTIQATLPKKQTAEQRSMTTQGDDGKSISSQGDGKGDTLFHYSETHGKSSVCLDSPQRANSFHAGATLPVKEVEMRKKQTERGLSSEKNVRVSRTDASASGKIVDGQHNDHNRPSLRSKTTQKRGENGLGRCVCVRLHSRC